MERKTAKILGVFLALVLPVLMIATASLAGVDWKAELGDHSGKTLRVIMIADPWVPAFEKINPEFEELTGAKVIIDSYGYDATHEKQVLEGTQKSGAFDVIVLDSPWVGEFWEAGYVEDLKGYIDKTKPEVIQYDDFVEVFRVISDWNGHIVGMPFGAYFVTLDYRKDLFEQEGFTPPKTFAEWKKIAAHFTKNDKYPGMYGLAMNNLQGSPVGQAWFEYIWNFGGKPFKSCFPGSDNPYADVKPMINSPEGVAAVELMKEMLQYEPPGALSMAWDERAQAFASGRVAMVSAWSVRTPIFLDPNRSGIAEKFGSAVIPATEGLKPVPPVGGWVMGLSKYSKQKDLAWDYTKWFTSVDIHKKFVVAGGPPSRYTAFQDSELVSKFPWFKHIEESAAMAYADCRPRIPESFEIISTVGLYVSRALTGEMSAEEAMGKANAEISDLLKKGGYNMSE
jgi:multiple sugar transport system substrate-binding protein